MQKFVLKLAGLGLAAAVLLFTACEDELVTPALGPEIRVIPDPGFVDVASDVEINTAFSVKLQASQGDALLNTIEINADGVKLDASRFTINSGAIASNNPFLLVGADQSGATYEIVITSSGTELEGDVESYEFILSDVDGETDMTSVSITRTGPPFTELELAAPLEGILFNQAGPAGQGALDLDAGLQTGVSSTDPDNPIGTTPDQAEIRDLGIDCTATGDENWATQFGTVNGADMRKVDLVAMEGFTFETATTKEILAEAYSTGTVLSDGVSTAADCTETAVTDVSGAVAVDDLFVVSANGKIYLVRVDAINKVASSNGDNYVLSINY